MARRHSRISSHSSKSDCSIDFTILDQDLSECLMREPSSSILADKKKKKSFPDPVWGKRKIIVTLKDKPESESEEENEASPMVDVAGARISTVSDKKLHQKRSSKSSPAERKRSKTPKKHDSSPGKNKANKLTVTRVKGRQDLKDADPVLVKETKNVVVAVSFADLDDDEDQNETPEQKSERLMFEAKRKAFYLSEGITARRPRNFVFEDFGLSSTESVSSTELEADTKTEYIPDVGDKVTPIKSNQDVTETRPKTDKVDRKEVKLTLDKTGIKDSKLKTLDTKDNKVKLTQKTVEKSDMTVKGATDTKVKNSESKVKENEKSNEKVNKKIRAKSTEKSEKSKLEKSVDVKENSKVDIKLDVKNADIKPEKQDTVKSKTLKKTTPTEDPSIKPVETRRRI